jgi:hypothetical protein
MLLPRTADEARRVVEVCRTSEGFLASVGRYRELWLRDLVYSEAPLLKLGYWQDVRNHLESFLSHQLPNGQVPTVLSRGWKRIFNQRFHSWTADTEPLLLIGAKMYADHTGDSGFIEQNRGRLELCLKFVESKLDDRGLIPGSDWRDAVIDYDRKFLFSNQVLLVEMHSSLGRTDRAEALGETIREIFRIDGEDYLADCVWWEAGELRRETRLDCLGISVSIISGVLEGERAASAARRMSAAKTPHGYRNVVPPLQIKRRDAFASIRNANCFARNGAFLRNRQGHYQNSAIWPFVEARVVAAFRKVALHDRAQELSTLMMNRTGFYEWYSPTNGRPSGSRDQLWTAAAVIEQVLAAQT